MDHTSTGSKGILSDSLLLPSMVEIDGRKDLDGGTSAPISFQRRFEDGCEKVLVVLTSGTGICEKAGILP